MPFASKLKEVDFLSESTFAHTHFSVKNTLFNQNLKTIKRISHYLVDINLKHYSTSSWQASNC